MGKLPFIPRIFWTVLPIVAVLIVATFAVLAKLSDYEPTTTDMVGTVLAKFSGYKRTTTDMVGAAISGLIFSYLVHLWLLPGDADHDEDRDAPT